MESVLGRYRNLVILVGVLFLQVLGLAMQVKRGSTETQDTRLIRVWVIGAVTPFERGLVWIQDGSHNIWHNYFYLRGVRAENRDLKAQIEQMRLEQVRLREDAAQARRLQTLLAFKEQYIAKTVAAQVIGSSGSDLSRIVYIDKGEDDGLKRDMAVITADGVVGKVLAVFKKPAVSQVLLINDQSSGVGAILEKSRLQGVLRGTASGEIALERVMSDEQVTAGETLMTSGGDQIFPKGLPIGTITKVSNGKDLFLSIRVRPAADLSKLEEVLVLVEKQERQATAEDKVRVRAADILAQRLPSVPDRPVADAASVAGTAAAQTAGAAKTATENEVSKPNPTGAVSTAPAAKSATPKSNGSEPAKTSDKPAVNKSAAPADNTTPKSPIPQKKTPTPDKKTAPPTAAPVPPPSNPDPNTPQ